MLKVVNVISDTNIGGAGKCVVNYANNFSSDRIDLTIVLPENSLLIDLLKNSKANVIAIGGLKDKSFDFKSYFKLRKIFKTIKPDVVHTHSAMIARIAAKSVRKTKTMYSKHCDYNLRQKEKKAIYKFIYKSVNLFFSNRIIAVSNSIKENLIERGIPNDKIDVVLNGVPKINKIQDKNKLLHTYNIEKDVFVVSIIARLVDDKDHKTFIDVAKKFNDNNITDIKFLIVGTGENEQKLRDYVKELNIKNVIFTGFVNKVENILNITSLQVNCSIGTEATSLSLLEGLSLGIPIVASDYGGNGGIVQDGYNGYLVPIKDVETFYKRIKEIKENKELYESFQNSAIKAYNDLFSIKKYVDRIEQVYFKI